MSSFYRKENIEDFIWSQQLQPPEYFLSQR